MCTRQSRQVIWDMITTLFLTLSSCRTRLLVLSFGTRKHMSMVVRANELLTRNHAKYLSGMSRALFPTAFLEIAVYQNIIHLLLNNYFNNINSINFVFGE